MVARTERHGLALSPRLVGFGGVVAAVAFVELLIQTGRISRFVVPPPSEIIFSFKRLILEEQVLTRLLQTGLEAFSAGILVLVVGLLLGAVLYRIPLLRAACETWVAAMTSAPLVLAYPLFLVMFGRNAFTIVMMGFIAGLAPMILKTVEGLVGTRRVLIDVGLSFKLKPVQLFWKILFPSAVPTLCVGLRLGMIFALINIVGVEYLINFGGLGQLINELAERYDLAAMYAAICFVILVSVAFFVIMEKAERWLRPAS
jgi:NitT/TauT family transport system permease protein